jgi:hypothetical protein
MVLEDFPKIIYRRGNIQYLVEVLVKCSLSKAYKTLIIATRIEAVAEPNNGIGDVREQGWKLQSTREQFQGDYQVSTHG